jgi:hypothetical protein
LNVYNVLSQKVDQSVNQYQGAGIYFSSLKAYGFCFVKKMLLLK